MGTSIALQLARRGAGKIVLLEKHEIASGATGRSSAIVRMHYAHESLARMALRARTIYEQFDDLIGGECGFHRTGFIAMAGEAGLSTTEYLGAFAILERFWTIHGLGNIAGG